MQDFYRRLVQTAHFQSFVGQYHDYMAGALPIEDALKMQFVVNRLLHPEPPLMTRVPSVSTVTSPTAATTGKTFVAQTPNVTAPPPVKQSTTGRRTSRSTRRSSYEQLLDADATAWNRFPELNIKACGPPRKVVFPRQSADVITSSLGTLQPKPATRTVSSLVRLTIVLGRVLMCND